MTLPASGSDRKHNRDIFLRAAENSANHGRFNRTVGREPLVYTWYEDLCFLQHG